MRKSRQELNIHCSTCPVSRLCLAHKMPSDVMEWLNQSIIYAKVFQPGDRIFRPNAPATHAFALRSGTCKESRTDQEGEEHVQEFYGAGDIIGLEYANESNYPALDVVATEPTLACLIPISIIQQPKPLLYPRIFKLICEKIKQQRNYPVCTNAKARVAAFFIRLINHEQSKFSKDGAIPIHLTNIDISRRIGIAQETLCRILKSFSLKGWLIVKNHLISSYDLEALKKLK